MDIRQLQAFIAVAEHGSFSAAANALLTVQSNVSTHVARLERELETELIDRGTREMTAAGAAIAPRVRVIINELAAIPSDLAALRDEITGSLHVGVIPSTARWLIPPMLSEVEKRLPEVKVAVTEAPTNTIVQAVANGELDGGVVSLPAKHPDMVTEVLFHEDVLLVVPADHPLGGRTSVDAATLSELELLLPPTGTPFRDELTEDFAALGVTLNVKLEVNGIRLVESLVVDGIAPALLPASATSAGLQKMSVEGLPQRTVGTIANQRLVPAAPAIAVRHILHEVVQATAPTGFGLRLPSV